jgi:UDP-N-acetyl-alpha-D-muramoyl-L-alanyl-L-glutamate epimerase
LAVGASQYGRICGRRSLAVVVTSVKVENTEPPFDATRCVAFRSIGWTFDEVRGEVACRYALEFDDGYTVVLAETFHFPNIDHDRLDDDLRTVVGRLLDHLCVIAGLSYYKLAAPAQVRVDHGSWTSADADYHRTLLTNGLGEFSWENNLPLLQPTWTYRELVVVPHTPITCTLTNGPLTPVGGGKDSCVSIELLRRAGHLPTLVTVRRFPVIADVIAASGLADVSVGRLLDPQLGALVRSGALNGHVPVTAIVTWASLVAAALGGHDAVVLSNERSASEGNVVYRGVEINHQWSKGAEAEALLSSALARITPSLRAFSLLRGLSELSIARLFAELGARYFTTFSSCNGAFRTDPTRRVDRWDATCAKCQFVFLALATVLPRVEVEAIWGADVFAVSDIAGFEALLGLTSWKPFECVGESLECRVALAMISERTDWSDHPVVNELVSRVREANLWPTHADRTSILAARVVDLPVPYAAVVNP